MTRLDGQPWPDFPTRTGLLPLLCAAGLHWPLTCEPDHGVHRDTCQRCGATRFHLGQRRTRWDGP